MALVTWILTERNLGLLTRRHELHHASDRRPTMLADADARPRALLSTLPPTALGTRTKGC